VTPFLKVALAGMVAVPVATAGGVAVTGVAVVDVQKDGKRIWVPVPLALAHVAAAFVPEHKTRLPRMGEEAKRYLPIAREMLAALGDAEDGELIRVEEPGKTVVIVKEGGTLRVKVDERGKQVDLNVPIRMALSILPDADGRLTASAALFALQHARYSKVVDVTGRDGERVRITVY
jgi:hypothetical protein